MFFGSLRRQLIFGVAVVNTVMMGWFVMDVTHRQETLLLDRQAEQATALTQYLATASNHWLAAHDISGLQELIEAQRRYPELRFAMLLDRDGRILAHTDRSRLGQFIQDLPSRVEQTELVRNRAMVDVIVPVMMSGRHVGWARIGLSQLLAGQKLAEISRNGIVYALAAIFLGSFITWVLGRRVTRRLYVVRATIDKVKAGNLLARSPLTGTDEAAALGCEFNAMLDTLDELNTKMRINEEKFRTLAENSPDIIIRYDREYRRIYVNPAYEKSTGIHTDQAVSRPPDEQWQGNVPLDEYNDRLRQVLAIGQPCEFVLNLPDKQGNPAVYSLIVVPERNPEGEILGVLVMGRDITELKKGEESLHLQTVELEEEMAERQMAQEALQEQAALLKAEIKKRQEAQDELEQMNENLEQRVQERTAELREKNAEVQLAYDNLKKVQAQLLQQDKMASVGQLAAGVAHEINNPMGFIICNLGSLGKYVEKLTAYLDANEKVLAGCDPETRQMAALERQRYKIDHIRKDMPDLITESSDGAQRVRKIVQDLKSFSRINIAEFTYADINDGLETTLSIAWNELKYKATVTREFGRLPHVWCNLGQINQVFLNLLVNAAHSIVDHGEIRITTWEEEGSVRIVINDTGVGIPPENVKRIFDPFFTTKEVGKGTGLGLSIAYDIVVNKHGGSIKVASEVGVGTSFTIILPVTTTEEGET